MPSQGDALGGYLGVEPAQSQQAWPWPAGHLYQSGRAAFLALLQWLAPRAVWMPWFICDAMVEPLSRAGVEVRRYALGSDFRIAAAPHLAARDLLLYVNYFGLNDEVVQELEATFPREQLIFDHAQALYSPPAGCATIYSPRKFVGVPDGGILMTAHPVPAPAEEDDRSVARLRARKLRDALGAEAGYAAFLQAEASLCGQPARRMSALTQRLLAGIDHAGVAASRRRNFEYLHDALQRHNRLQPRLAPGQVPMCYPFWPERPIERALLHRNRVYVATYWPELLNHARPAPAAERIWAREWLPLPIDQRCDTAQLGARVVAPLLEHLRGSGAE